MFIESQDLSWYTWVNLVKSQTEKVKKIVHEFFTKNMVLERFDVTFHFSKSSMIAMHFIILNFETWEYSQPSYNEKG